MKNTGYLVEFISDAGNEYYECGYGEFRQIMSTLPASEGKDRTNCAVSWAEHAERCHQHNLDACL